MVFRLIYSSEASSELTADDIENILGEARENNKKIDITGVLVHLDNIFIQVLEGKKEQSMNFDESLSIIYNYSFKIISGSFEGSRSSPSPV